MYIDVNVIDPISSDKDRRMNKLNTFIKLIKVSARQVG